MSDCGCSHSKCNKTPKGKMCPKHGMDDCTMKEETDPKGPVKSYKSPEEIAKKHKVPLSKILQQVKTGTKIEGEHTTSKSGARITALQHVEERPDYYTRLKKAEQVKEGNLHQWFKGSKSKDGKPGWVNVVTGGTCASDEPGEGTPKCVSSSKRASMTKAERLSASRRKKESDPGQQEKSGAAKPTYVSTDKPKKMNEESDKKSKSSGKKDACYNKVKSRYSVWPSAYASGALVKCRKAGAANWGNKSEDFIPEDHKEIASGKKKDDEGYMANIEMDKIERSVEILRRIIKQPQQQLPAWVQSKITRAADFIDTAAEYLSSDEEVSEACWKGYKQLGMKKKGDKVVPNCVKEDYTRLIKNGQTLQVTFTWRGLTNSLKIFFPSVKVPTRQEVQDAIRKFYPQAVVVAYGLTAYDPSQPMVLAKEEVEQIDEFLGTGRVVAGRSQAGVNPGSRFTQAGTVQKVFGVTVPGSFEQGASQSDVQRHNQKAAPNTQIKSTNQSMNQLLGRERGGQTTVGITADKKPAAPAPKPTPTAPKQTYADLGREMRSNIDKRNAALSAAMQRNSYEPEGELVDEAVLGRYKEDRGGGQALRSASERTKPKSKPEEPKGPKITKLKTRGPRKGEATASQVQGWRGSDRTNTNRRGQSTPFAKPVKEDIANEAIAIILKDPKKEKQRKNYLLNNKNITESTPAWQRKEGKNPEGGLNKKGITSYRKENPGSKLSLAVTTKPSKLKPGSKSAKRRKSFCARMSGMKSKLTSSKTANDPNSRINKSLRKWNC